MAKKINSIEPSQRFVGRTHGQGQLTEGANALQGTSITNGGTRLHHEQAQPDNYVPKGRDPNVRDR